jgi:hypothetical protein
MGTRKGEQEVPNGGIVSERFVDRRDADPTVG